MAALQTLWGPMSGREGTASERSRPRHESEERQRYRQPKPSEKKPTKAAADYFAEVWMESSPNCFVVFIDDLLGKERAWTENVESDLLPRVLTAIDGLMSPNEDDGDPAATEHAYKSARAVVESAYGRLLAEGEQQAKKLPAPIVTTDERGGVRVSWQHNDRHVRTSFASAEGLRSYLYFESPEEHDVEPLQPTVLSGRLDWMLKA
jgi:hypothetical protein